MVHVYHGDGKGKTTAAIGLSIRAAGAGMSVYFAQFLKGNDTSELNILNSISCITVIRNEKDLGFLNQMSEIEKEEVKKMHNRTLNKIIQCTEEGKVDLVVLDEITYPFRYNLIDKDKFIKWMEQISDSVELVLTGRDPDSFFLEHGDYITEMVCEKHPFQKQVMARKGIEY